MWETTVSLSIRGRSWILNLSPKYLITQGEFNSWYIIKDLGTLIIFTYQVKKIKRKKEKQSSAMFFSHITKKEQEEENFFFFFFSYQRKK